MLSTPNFVAHLSSLDFGPYVGVPCSFLKPFINYVIESPELDYLAANNEGEAIAIAAGACLAGRRPVVMFQNSGLGNTVNPLTSLVHVFRIPLLLICTWRGEPGVKDAPQHHLMGDITPALFDVLRIPHEIFPEGDSEIAAKVERAVAHMRETGLPYALIMRKGTVTPYELRDSGHEEARPPDGRILSAEMPGPEIMLRREAIATVADALDSSALIVATTGKTARELSAYRDRPGNFYVVGSMGCASSLALGVALYARNRPVVVLDGDGAALMRLEAMVSIGHYRPSNFVHVILDNGVHESTGGQRTLADGVQFPAMAVACGYRTAVSVNSAGRLQEAVTAATAARGPHLVHVRIRAGSDPELPRPALAPPELARRFRQAVGAPENAFGPGCPEAAGMRSGQ